MTRFSTWALVTLGAASWLSAAAPAALAQTVPAPAKESASAPEDYSYYKAIPPKVVTPTIAQQKSIARAEQRMARLDAMKWYGFSGTRPTASGMPWTTMYSPAWQQPGGRPFAWYVSERPVMIYLTPSPVYR